MNSMNSTSLNDTELIDDLTTVSPQNNYVVYVSYPDWYHGVYNVFNYGLNVMQFFGLFINLLHFSILTRPSLRSIAIYRLMIGICSCDILTNIFTFLIFSPFWIRSPRLPEEECYFSSTYMDIFLDIYGIIVLDSTQRTSSWLAVLMALYRTLSIMFPMSPRIQKMSTPTVALYSVLVVQLLSFGWGWEVMCRKVIAIRSYDYECDGNMVKLNTTRYWSYVPPEDVKMAERVVFIYGFVKALPSLIDPILSFFLIVELRRASSRRKGLQSNDNVNVTKLIFFMTVSFMVLEIPNGFAHVVSVIFHENPAVFTASLLVAVFAEILPVTNSISHVFICLLMSSQYRETARGMYWKKKQEVVFVEENTSNIKKNSSLQN